MKADSNSPFFKKVLADILHTLKHDKSYDLNGAIRSIVSANYPNLSSQEFADYLKIFKKAVIEEQQKELLEMQAEKDKAQAEKEMESLDNLKGLRDRIKELLANRDFEGGLHESKEEEKEYLVQELKKVSYLINKKEGGPPKMPLR